MANRKQNGLNPTNAILIVGILIAAVLYINENGLNLPQRKTLGTEVGTDTQPAAKPNADKLATDLFKTYAQETGLDEEEFSRCLDEGQSSQEIQDDYNEGSDVGVSGTPSFFVNGQQIEGAQPYSVFKEKIEQELGGDTSELAVDITDEPSIGEEDAPIVVIEFTDYQCPFCERAFSTVFSQLKQDYIETGQVKYVVKDFPLPFHPNAQKAAEAANCASDQGKYWEMHNKLFDEQANWEGAKAS